MEGLGVIVFIVIAVLAAMSRAKQMGSGTGAPRPGTRLPPRPGTPPGPPARPGSSLQVPDVPMPQAGSRAEAERAATLVPDDLWAILTGERRSPLPPRPLETPHEITLPGTPPPAPVAERGSSSFESVHRPQPPAAPAPAPPPRPVIVPSVTPSIAPAAMSAPAPVAAAVVAEPAGAAAPARAGRPLGRGTFAGPAELRRAFVAQLVLGPPKALE